MDLTACFPVIVAVQGLLCIISEKQFCYLQPEEVIDKPPERVSNAASSFSSTTQKGVLSLISY